MKYKSISPLIATILLIVVSVILITVVLTWGSSFAKEKLSTAKNSSIQNTDLTGLISSRSISSQNILISNNSSKDLNITGYKIISSIDHYLYSYFENKIYNLDQPLIINPNSAQTLKIDCFPESSFFIDLITDQNIHVRTQISARSINDVDSFKCGLILDFDSTSGVLKENTGKSFTPNNINILELGNGYTSASFNGTNSYINFGNVGQFETYEPFSVLIWIKNNDTTFDGVGVGFFGNAVYKNGGWMTAITSNLNFAIVTNNTTGENIANINISDNLWHLIILTYDGQNLTSYFDTEKKLTNFVTITKNSSNLILGNGSQGGWGTYFNGLIPSAKIYNRTLSENEINLIYKNTKRFIE